MPRPLSLNLRIFLAFVLFAALLLAALGVLSYRSGSRALQDAATAEMVASAIEKQARIEAWIDERVADVEAMAASPALQQWLDDLLAAGADRARFDAAQRHLQAELSPTGKPAQNLRLVALVDIASGDVLIANDSRLADSNLGDREVIRNSRTATYVQGPHRSPLLQIPGISIGTPVRAGDGSVRAILAGLVDIEPLAAMLREGNLLRQSAESYLVDSERRFVTQPRLLDRPVVLREQVQTEAIQRCLSGDSGTLTTTDYRDLPAIIAYRWLPRHRLCLISKIDRAEALAPAKQFGRAVSFASGLILVLAAVLALRIVQTIEHPVRALRDGIARYWQGDHTARLTVTSRDVLGDLAAEFNRLADRIAENDAQLRANAEHLEEQVAQRSDELNRFFVLSLDLLCIASFDGRFIRLNPAWERVLGYRLSELEGHPFIDFVHEDDRAATVAEAAKLSQGVQTISFENRYRCRDGSYRWLLWQAAPSPEAGLIYAAARDVTERKKVLTELEQAKNAAEDASRAKSDFLANMSHEIRTPLNGVLGTIGLLEKTGLSAQQRELAGLARASGETLLTILNDLLDFAKIEAGKLSIEALPFDLLQTTEEVIGMIAPQAASKELDLVLRYPAEVPRFFVGDAARIRQILTNLANNALKFTDQGHVFVAVSVLAGDAQSTRVRISVEDSGIGIPADKQDRLFQKFSQADASTTRRFGGTGLGLAISKQLVELMGGTIGVSSQEGEGSTFWFELELDLQRGVFAPQFNAALEGTRVLIVDDNAVNRRVLHEQLIGWRLRNGSCASAQEALDKLRAAQAEGDPYPIAILDHQMPDMDGEMLARAIKADPKLADTQLLMLSSLGRGHDQGRLAALGVSAYLVKPVRQSDLLNALLGLRGLAPAARQAPPQPLGQGPGSGARILLAEDNLTNQFVAAMILKSLGCMVEVAGNGVQALQMIEAADYDLVFMDCEMPVMDGFAATRAIRDRTGAKSRLPIIAVTAQALSGDRERCAAAGMNDYISKPVNEAAFAAVLQRWWRADAVTAKALPAPPATVLEPSAPALDGDTLRRLQAMAAATDPRLFGEILAAFENDAAQRIADMRRAVAAGDAGALRAAAHALKGASANLGARPMAELCEALQQCGQSGVLTAADALLERLQRSHAQVLSELRPWTS